MAKDSWLWNALWHIYILLNKRRWRVNYEEIERRIRKHAENEKNFFFIQIGANDGVMMDPIHDKILEYGWKGILVEPLPTRFHELVSNYEGVPGLVFENFAISDREGQGTLYTVKDEAIDEDWQRGLATFTPASNEMKDIDPAHILEMTVSCETMTRLIDKYEVERIDLLQVDTEGYDYEIIKMIDWERAKPKIICYEHRCLTARDREDCRTYLKTRGYEIIEGNSDTAAFLL